MPPHRYRRSSPQPCIRGDPREGTESSGGGEWKPRFFVLAFEATRERVLKDTSSARRARVRRFACIRGDPREGTERPYARWDGLAWIRLHSRRPARGY